jgi:hypothetical protein
MALSHGLSWTCSDDQTRCTRLRAAVIAASAAIHGSKVCPARADFRGAPGAAGDRRGAAFGVGTGVGIGSIPRMSSSDSDDRIRRFSACLSHSSVH